MAALDRQQNILETGLRSAPGKKSLRRREARRVDKRAPTGLGVSRTPIREAIRLLADNGLVSIVPHMGTSVALINAKRVEELYLIRTSLEMASSRLAAERFDGKADRTLRNLIDQQTASLKGPDFARHIAVDNECHRSIAEISGLTLIWGILQQVMGEVTRLRHLSIRLPGRRTEPIEEHIAILKALKSNNPEDSGQAMKAHLERSYQSVLTSLARFPEYLEVRCRAMLNLLTPHHDLVPLPPSNSFSAFPPRSALRFPCLGL